MAVFWAFLAIALKTSLLVSAAGIAVATLANASAAYRHLVWTAALALAAALPVAVFYLPFEISIPMLWPMPATVAAPASGAVASAATAAAAGGFDSSAYVRTALLSLWAVGALALILRDAAAHAGLVRWRRNARPLTSGPWQATLDGVAQAHGLPRRLVVLESPELAAPCTWGVFRPVLLLPHAGETWSESERRHALIHEIAHIRRHDYLSALVSRLCRAVHWYNPLVWFAATQVTRLQEQACDDAVLRDGSRPSEYARLLLNLAADSSGPARVAMGMAARSHLGKRVVAILGGERIARVEPGMIAILGVMLVLTCVMFFIATASAAPEPQTKDWAGESRAAADAATIYATTADATARGASRRGHVSHTVSVTENADERIERVTDINTDTDTDTDTNTNTDTDTDTQESDNVVEDEEDTAPAVETDGSDETDEHDEDNVESVNNVHGVVRTSSSVPVISMRRMVVHVPPVPAVNTPDVPGRNIEIEVPTRMGDDGNLVIERRVIRIPAIHGVHVAGMPTRRIVVTVPVVQAVPPVPPVPPVPRAHRSTRARPAIPAEPALPPTPPVPDAPDDEQ